jgi:hypothetical protein
MFRRSMLAVAAVLAVSTLAFASPAMASPTTCVVTPDPVSISGNTFFNVAANGLDPSTFYYILVTEPAAYQTGHHPYGSSLTDASGNLSEDVYMDIRLNFTPVPGAASIKVYKAYQGGQTGSACGFTFVA